jgi:hypothetical protein
MENIDITARPQDINCEGPIMTLDCLLEKIAGTPEPPKIYRGIMNPSVGCFFGPAKSGKTTLVENILLSIAAGLPEFLGESIQSDNNRILLIGLEEYYRSRTARNKRQKDAITEEHNLNPSWGENVYVVGEDFIKYVTSPQDWELLEKQLEIHNPGIVMIDSLTRLCLDPIEDSATASKIMKRLRDLSHKYGTTIILIHHSHKLEDRPITIASLAGSRVVGQEMDFMIGVNRSTNGVRYFKDVSYRYHPDDSEFVTRFSINDQNIIVFEGNVHEADILKSGGIFKSTNASETAVHKFMIEQTGDDPSKTVNAADLYKHLEETKILSRPTLHKALEKLIEKGLISKPAKGVYKINITS